MAFAKQIIALLLLFSAVSSSALADEYVKVQVAEPYIELRSGPGRGYPIFYIAERGERVDVLMQRTDWYKVRTRKGKEGWVSLEQMGKTLTADGQLLAVAYPDFEAYKQRTWELGVMTGTFSGADVVSAYGGYHFTRNLSAELELSQYFGSFSNGTVGTVNLVQQPFPEWRITPFFTLGVGRILTEPKATLVQTKDRDDELVNVGVGVRYYLTRRFIVRAQYKNYVVFTNRDSNDNIDEWKIGFSAFF
jgi:uncharacterized protein YgiM (DUF1202 family)